MSLIILLFFLSLCLCASAQDPTPTPTNTPTPTPYYTPTPTIPPDRDEVFSRRPIRGRFYKILSIDDITGKAHIEASTRTAGGIIYASPWAEMPDPTDMIPGAGSIPSETQPFNLGDVIQSSTRWLYINKLVNDVSKWVTLIPIEAHYATDVTEVTCGFKILASDLEPDVKADISSLMTGQVGAVSLPKRSWTVGATEMSYYDEYTWFYTGERILLHLRLDIWNWW